jgi:nucleotide-binding universal stress UspA family protein
MRNSTQTGLKSSAEQSLRDVIGKEISEELRIHAMVVQGDAANEIVEIADRKSIDLVVIATHGKTGWRRAVFGSVAEKVVRLAGCPVLTIQAAHREE